MTATIAIIGSGNMGQSILSGLIKSGHPAEHIWAADPNQSKLDALHQQFSIHTAIDNETAANKADVIIFSVKPHDMANVVKSLAQVIAYKKPLLISIAAGIHTHSIERWLSNNIALVRAMPNTPALINASATALYANTHVTQDQKNVAENILRAVGSVVWITDESDMDVITALSGCGPAYFLLVMEALQAAAEELGLAKETARLLTLQTAIGASRMALESTESVVELRKKVTSPGGTTEKAISVLEKNQLREIFLEAIKAAKVRSEELARSFGE